MEKVTKKHRLQQLKTEEKVFNALCKELDKQYFDPAWKRYIKDLRAKQKISNDRMYKILTKIKGAEFSDDVKGLMKAIKHEYALIRFTRNPKGIEINDSRYSTIKKIWYYQKSGSIYTDDTSKGYTGSLAIQITDNRWIEINFSNC